MNDPEATGPDPAAQEALGTSGTLRSSVEQALAPEFEILRPIGSGRTSHVFLARESALKRLVAVKVLRPEVGENETVRARFEREARSLAGISHPQVPAVYRVGRLDSGLPYMIEKYIEGRTLRDRLEATGPIKADEARGVLADIAAALAGSHAQGVIHRDVRPGNVMMERDTGRAFLTDFGLAAARETGAQADARLTQTGEILGDPHYASPEQLRGEAVTAQADVYSLGVLGYEILTLSNPFGSGSRQELFTAHLRGDPRELPWEVTARDPELGNILKRCLQKEPTRRPRAEEVRRALSGETGSGGSGEGVEGILEPFPRMAALYAELKRRRVVQMAIAYGVAALFVIEGAQLVLIDGLGAPASLYTGLVLLALAGFPAMLVFSWLFDLTRKGIERTEPSESRTGRGLKISALLLASVVAIAAGWWWYFLR